MATAFLVQNPWLNAFFHPGNPWSVEPCNPWKIEAVKGKARPLS
jgi:hypothetical protein